MIEVVEPTRQGQLEAERAARKKWTHRAGFDGACVEERRGSGLLEDSKGAVMRRQLRAAIVGLVFLSGCVAGGMQYQQIGQTYPRRGSADDIRIFEKTEPPEQYDRVGQIVWDYSRRKFDAPTVREILPDMKQKAWEVGGDALIIRDLTEPRNPDGTLHVAADVVRWRR